MAALEKVMQMKQQGLAEPQIVQSLKQEGVSPKDINEALSQSKIKTELASQQEATIPGAPAPGAMPEGAVMPAPTGMPGPATAPQAFTQEAPEAQMQPSMMEAAPEEAGMPAPEAALPEPAMPAPTAYPAPTEMAPAYEEYQPQQTTDIETINDIAEQIVEEKTDAIKNQIRDFTRFKDELALEVDKINERLSRIENTFNELQMAILKRIGEYGEDIKNISKEMHATQDSFSKVIDPLTDNVNALQEITGKSAPAPEKAKPKPKTEKEGSSDFENYLR